MPTQEPTFNSERVVPSVSFGIELGQMYEQIDFDYSEFGRLTTALCIDSDELSQLSIEISSKSHETALVGARGGYSPKLKKIVIRPAESQQTNKSLIHEFRHFGDDLIGKLNRKTAVTVNLSKLLSVGGMAIGLSGGILGSTLQIEEVTEWSVGLFWGSNAVLIATYLGYLVQPHEMRARRAARKFEECQPIKITKPIRVVNNSG